MQHAQHAGFRCSALKLNENTVAQAGELVGTTGFEPVTTTPPVWCATRLRYAPNRRHSIP